MGVDKVKEKIVASILCFGDRHEYIQDVVYSCKSLNINTFIVFCNAISDDYAAKIRGIFESSDLDLHILHSENNAGSAGGFRSIISYYYNRTDADYLLLLDDDSILQSVYDDFRIITEGRPVISLYRSDRKSMRDVLEGKSPKFVYPPAGSVLGFDVVYYLRKLLLGSSIQGTSGLASSAGLHEAPYGGLILHRSAVSAVGFPRSDFFLYADDIEFSRRLTGCFGPIPLEARISIREMDASWNAGTGSNNFLFKLRASKNFVRNYYSVRNRIFIDRSASGRSVIGRIRFRINYALVRLLIWTFWPSADRRPLNMALRDGTNGNLGKIDDRLL